MQLKVLGYSGVEVQLLAAGNTFTHLRRSGKTGSTLHVIVSLIEQVDFAKLYHHEQKSTTKT